MNSIPNISRSILVGCFNDIVHLFERDQIKLLEAAERTLSQDPSPFIVAAGDIAPQITALQHRIQRISNNYGRNVLINWIEELYINLKHTGGAIGVSSKSLLASASILIDTDTHLKLLENGRWIIQWDVPLQDGNDHILMPIRDRSVSVNDIIPNYIIQYIDQALIAYRRKKYLTALALISIALEGTLRDALEHKGFTYTLGTPTNDIYQIEEMHILNSVNGFEVQFPNAMPKNFQAFLTESGVNSPLIVRVKRIKKNNKYYLEIRDADYLMEYWTSDVVSQAGQTNIAGLGTALHVARNNAGILNNSILPDDMDEVIKQVRNNLIHLSGSALTNTIRSVGISLEEYAQNQERVFDTIWSISGTIEKLYLKKELGTL